MRDFEKVIETDSVTVRQRHWDLEKAILNSKEILMDFDSVIEMDFETDSEMEILKRMVTKKD